MQDEQDFEPVVATAEFVIAARCMNIVTNNGVPPLLAKGRTPQLIALDYDTSGIVVFYANLGWCDHE